MAAFQPPTASSSRHQELIAKLHQVAELATPMTRREAHPVAVSRVSPSERREWAREHEAEEGKKEFRRSAPRVRNGRNNGRAST